MMMRTSMSRRSSCCTGSSSTAGALLRRSLIMMHMCTSSSSIKRNFSGSSHLLGGGGGGGGGTGRDPCSIKKIEESVIHQASNGDRNDHEDVVVVGLSGGVDSSVSALLLKRLLAHRQQRRQYHLTSSSGDYDAYPNLDHASSAAPDCGETLSLDEIVSGYLHNHLFVPSASSGCGGVPTTALPPPYYAITSSSSRNVDAGDAVRPQAQEGRGLPSLLSSGGAAAGAVAVGDPPTEVQLGEFLAGGPIWWTPWEQSSIDGAKRRQSSSCKKTRLVGVYMQNWRDNDGGNSSCSSSSSVSQYCDSSEADLRDAERTAHIVGLDDFKVVDFSSEYMRDCFDPMVAQFAQGKTLNVDVLCNEKIKFGAFLRHCKKHLRAKYVATGHYARIVEVHQQLGSQDRHWTFREGGDHRLSSSTMLLRPPLNFENDQSYFLSRVPSVDGLDSALFPLAHMCRRKAEQVRQIAQRYGLGHVATKNTSVGLCFVSSGSVVVGGSSSKQSSVKAKPEKQQRKKKKKTFVDLIAEHASFSSSSAMGDSNNSSTAAMRPPATSDAEEEKVMREPPLITVLEDVSSPAGDYQENLLRNIDGDHSGDLLVGSGQQQWTVHPSSPKYAAIVTHRLPYAVVVGEKLALTPMLKKSDKSKNRPSCITQNQLQQNEQERCGNPDHPMGHDHEPSDNNKRHKRSPRVGEVVMHYVCRKKTQQQQKVVPSATTDGSTAVYLSELTMVRRWNDARMFARTVGISGFKLQPLSCSLLRSASSEEGVAVDGISRLLFPSLHFVCDDDDAATAATHDEKKMVRFRCYGACRHHDRPRPCTVTLDLSTYDRSPRMSSSPHLTSARTTSPPSDPYSCLLEAAAERYHHHRNNRIATVCASSHHGHDDDDYDDDCSGVLGGSVEFHAAGPVGSSGSKEITEGVKAPAVGQLVVMYASTSTTTSHQTSSSDVSISNNATTVDTNCLVLIGSAWISSVPD